MHDMLSKLKYFLKLEANAFNTVSLRHINYFTDHLNKVIYITCNNYMCND